MKLAIFNDCRLGLVVDDDIAIVDVTDALEGAHDRDPLTAGWWRRLCRDNRELLPLLRQAAVSAPRIAIDEVQLRAPVMGPTKIIACAVNYRGHVAEMRDVVLERTGSDQSSWMLDFDIFLKAPSSIIGTGDVVVLPPKPVSDGQEIHHESELAFVIGKADPTFRPARPSSI